MESLIQYFLSLELWMQVLIIAEYILFLFYLISVIYLFIFAASAMVQKGNKYAKAKKEYKYAVIFTADEQQEIIVDSVKSFLQQAYPTNRYDLIVASNSLKEEVKQQLAMLPIKVLLNDAPLYNKTESIQFAMANLDDSYEVAVIMNADNTTEISFLEEINNAYYCGGMAIQTHRVAKNIDTNTALLDAVSEEINNSIFRLGHVNIGFSSALIGSGMVFNFEWLKENIQKATSIDIGKQLETMLIEQFIFIEYLNKTLVYGEKSSSTSTYYKQRQNWLISKMANTNMASRKLISSLFKGNYDYCNKLFQWIMPSRTILLGTLVIITAVLTYFTWQISIKWWAILLILIITFSMAIPDYLVDSRFIKAMKTAPLLFILMIYNNLRTKARKA